MAYGIPEFPSGNMYDNDLAELLDYYRKLRSEYGQFLKELEELRGRVTTLEEHIDEVLDQKLETVYARIKELNDRMTTIDQQMETLQKYVDDEVADAKQYVDSEIAKANAQIDQTIKDLQSEVADEITTIRREISNMKDYVDDEVDNLNRTVTQEITALRQWTREYVTIEVAKFQATLDQLNADIVEVKRYSDLKNGELYNTLAKMISDLEDRISKITVDQVWVKNPYDGKIQNIQDVIDSIWEHTDWWSLTAAEYDSLELTADEYDNWDDTYLGGKGLTAEQYDFLGRWYLAEKGGLVRYLHKFSDRVMEYCKRCCKEVKQRLDEFAQRIYVETHMFSPFTGKQDSLKNIINAVFGFLSYGALTAQEYDDLELTAEDYDNMNITAYDYDWYGIKKLTGNTFIGLTAEQYDNCGVAPDGHVVYIATDSVAE